MRCRWFPQCICSCGWCFSKASNERIFWTPDLHGFNCLLIDFHGCIETAGGDLERLQRLLSRGLFGSGLTKGQPSFIESGGRSLPHPQSGRGITPKLFGDYLWRGECVGHQRQNNAEIKNRDGGKSPVPFWKQRHTNILAALSESASKLSFPGQAWTDYLPERFFGLPDFPCVIDIEVKASLWAGVDAAFKIEQGAMYKDRAYVLAVGTLHPYWWIVGWMWGWEIIEKGKLRSGEPGMGPYYYCDTGFRKIYELQHQIANIERFLYGRSKYEDYCLGL